jgi:hypothetical protein
MKVCFWKLEPQTRVSGKQDAAAKGKTLSVCFSALVIAAGYCSDFRDIA